MTGYLAGWAFFCSLSWGALFLVLIGELCPSRWLSTFRAPLVAVSQLGLVVPLAFFPLVFALKDVHPWVADPPNFWWSPTAFLIRAAAVLASSFVLALAVVVRRKREPSPWFGALGLIVLSVVVASGSIDWIMTRTDEFESTVFPLIVLASGIVSALACAAIVAARAPVDAVADLASMLFSSILFWAYVSFSQLLIVWIGDVPRETRYYVERIHGGWVVFATLLPIGALAVPLSLLVFRRLKRRPRAVVVVGVLALTGQLADSAWCIGPSSSVGFYLLGFALAVVPGLSLLAFFLSRRRDETRNTEARSTS